MYGEIVEIGGHYMCTVLMPASLDVFLCKKYNCTIWVYVSFLNIVVILFYMKTNEGPF